jgi:hypothetical protein
MNPAHGHGSQKQLTKRSEVRTVAEASGRNGDQFSARFEQVNRDGEKSSVQIACFYTDRAEQMAMP